MNNIRFCIAILLGLCLLSSCNKDDDGRDFSPSPIHDVSRVNMIVTNNLEEDLILKSSDYAVTSKGVETFAFDSWEVYMNGDLLQSSKENIEYRRKRVDHYHENPDGKRIVNLESDLIIDEKLRADGYKKSCTWEYVITSYSLFGDSNPHSIRINYQPRFETLLQVEIEYTIFVDDIQQTVLYPKGWKLEPKIEYGTFIRPCFILNIDKL